MNQNDEPVRKLSEVFQELLKNQGLDDKMRKAKVLSMWKEIVGPLIARNTHHLKFDNNKLIVYVRSDALKQELIYMKQQLIQNIHQAINEEFIEDIIFY